MNFSERNGYQESKIEIQKESLDIQTRNLLWNVFCQQIFFKNITKNTEITMALSHRPENEINDVLLDYYKSLCMNYLKVALDTFPFHDINKLYEISRNFFMKFDWNEVLDILEFTVQFFNDNILVNSINEVLEKELTAYRIVNNQIIPITNDLELKMMENAFSEIKKNQFETVSIHINSAIEKISNRQNPDYRNSIKEAISAVESMCKIITGDKNATLGQAIKKLNLHPALEEGFKKFYGYTSNHDGIRHSLMDIPNLDFEDAYYFLISCSAFVNYLIQKFFIP